MKIEDCYFSVVNQHNIYQPVGNLKFYLKQIFRGVDFKDKSMLDIGGGNGIYSFYAAISGAKEVICLEPELEGSAEKQNEQRKMLKSSLRVENLKFESCTFQQYEPASKIFDIILMHNSINHLEEESCLTLENNENSRSIYRYLFKKLSEISKPGTVLIICDCSRVNFWNTLGLKNPFLRTIEWNKHQTPELWISLLKEVDFYNPEINWTSFNSFRYPGKILLGNKVMSYLTLSHFCLKMIKVS